MTIERLQVAMRAVRILNVIKAAIVAVALSVASPVAAQDFDTGHEAYQRGDYAAALDEWRPLADQGNPKAQNGLSHMYRNGLGVPQDHAEAAKWVRMAAEQGHILAQFGLGLMYAEGQGVAQDYVQALMWWSLAASQGDGFMAMGRFRLASEMTSAQIAKAEKLAREWKPK